MTSRRLSVIVPVKDGAPTIAQLLDSLAQQQGREQCEFIVVDDGSTDATAQILDRYPWLQVVRHERNRGAGAARNSGARTAQGELLLFLDADTRVVEADFLLRCAAFFDARPEYAAVSGCYHPSNDSRHWFGRYLDAAEAAMHENALDQPAPGTLNGCVCVMRSSVFAALGGFSESAGSALEDPDLGCRLVAAGYRHWFSGGLRVQHRQPGPWHYLRELVPRCRDYVRLIRQYGLYNEAMGGRREGVTRSLLLLGVLLLATVALEPVAAAAGLPLLALALWRLRPLWRHCLVANPPWLLPAALLFHVLTSLALVAGTLLGLLDAARHGLRRWLIDARVVLAYLRSLFTPKSPGQVIHFLTHRCNARCAHCFDEPQRRAIGRDQELDLPRIRSLARSLGALGHLSLTGGEPLLREDLAEIIDAYYRAGVRSFGLNSNGSQPERLPALLHDLDLAAPRARLTVTVSIDGIGRTHDRIRGYPGLYRKAMRSLALLCEARAKLPQLRVHGCVTLSRANISEVDAILANLEALGLDQLEFARLRGTPADPALRGIDDAEYAAACASLARYNGHAGGLASLYARLDQGMAAIMRQQEQPWACGTCLAGRRLAVIRADGTVLPCEMLAQVRPADAARYDDFVMGRLSDFDDDLGALLQSPQARRLTDYIRDTQCRCSFECAIFATMAYRPWRLWRLLKRDQPVLAGKGAASAVR